MDGIHDMGGMDGFGPVVHDDVVFHTDWERRAFGLQVATSLVANVDDFRHAIERLDPAVYLSAGYYGRWLATLEVRLAERGLLSTAEVDDRAGDGAAARPKWVATVAAAGPEPTHGSRRDVDRPPLFRQGQAVRALDVHPHGHTRLPRYVRGRTGVIGAVRPAFVYPDSNAHGWGEDPQYVYGVAFKAGDLWGEGDHVVHVDIFEPHLEPV